VGAKPLGHAFVFVFSVTVAVAVCLHLPLSQTSIHNPTCLRFLLSLVLMHAKLTSHSRRRVEAIHVLQRHVTA
jgi:hypothetical protein